jgi:hypothetical protein
MSKRPNFSTSFEEIIQQTICLDYQHKPGYSISFPIGSPHTPPETQTPTPDTHSLHSAEPKPIHICQHTKSKIDHINHRREVLLQNFLKDQPEGSFANPIVIEDNDNENVSSLQRSEEAQRELVLRFSMYCGYNQ